MACKYGSFWFTLIPIFFCTDAMQHIKDYTDVRRRINNNPSNQDIDSELATIFQINLSTPRSMQYERALPTSSSIQRVHEQPRRRYHQGIAILSNRHQNASNKYEISRKGYPAVSRRTGSPSRENQYIPDIPEECKLSGICTDVPNYPEEYANKLIDQLGPAVDKFSVEELEPELTSRLGPVEQIIQLCSFRHEIVIPTAARDRDDKWHFILNNKDKPLQAYRAEICSNAREPCQEDLFNVVHGYKPICQQKFQDRAMTGFDASGDIIEKSFQIPSCCTCVLKKV